MTDDRYLAVTLIALGLAVVQPSSADEPCRGAVHQVLVVDAQGSPISEAVLQLATLAPMPPAPAGAEQTTTVAAVTTDRWGQATVCFAEQGVYLLSAELEGFVPTAVGPIELTEDGHPDLADPLVILLNPAIEHCEPEREELAAK